MPANSELAFISLLELRQKTRVRGDYLERDLVHLIVSDAPTLDISPYHPLL